MSNSPAESLQGLARVCIIAISGAVSGFFGVVVGHPLDTLKVRLQVGNVAIHSLIHYITHSLTRLFYINICRKRYQESSFVVRDRVAALSRYCSTNYHHWLGTSNQFSYLRIFQSFILQRV